jgi:hypothetical protein
MAEVIYRTTAQKKTRLPPVKSPLDEEITRERMRAIVARRQQAEMLNAKAGGELISKDTVEKQAAYLVAPEKVSGVSKQAGLRVEKLRR